MQLLYIVKTTIKNFEFQISPPVRKKELCNLTIV